MWKKFIIIVAIISALVAGLEAGVYATYSIGLRENKAKGDTAIVSEISEEVAPSETLTEAGSMENSAEEMQLIESISGGNREKGVYVTSVGSFVARNIVTCFAFSPSLPIMDVVKQIKNENLFHDTLYVFLTILYAIIIFLAPICTASAFYVFFGGLIQSVYWNLFFWIKRRNDPRIIVIGTSRTSESIIEHERNDAKEREIIYITQKEYTSAQKLQFQRKRIRLIHQDMLNCSEEEFEKTMKKLTRKQVIGIVMAETSSAANFSIYMRLMTLSRDYLSEKTMICCRCGYDTVRGLFTEYYMDHKGALPPKCFSLSELRAYSILENMPLPIVQPDETLKVTIAGFAETGKQLLRDIAYMGVCSRTNGIQIDVVDRNMDECMEQFLKNFAKDVLEINGNHCRIKNRYADGEFEIIFHKMDITSNAFADMVREQNSDYYAICIEDVETCVHGIVNINSLLKQKKHRISVSLMTDPEIAVYLKEDNKRYENTFISGTKTFLNLDYIMHKTLEDTARQFHETYQKLTPEQTSVHKVVDWGDLEVFKQMDNRCVSRHQIVKEQVADRILGANKKERLEAYFGPKGSLCTEIDGNYIITKSKKEFEKDIISDPFLVEMAAMEQRRWCYCRAITGWSLVEDENQKNDPVKLTPYLLNWEEVSCRYPDTMRYNLMPVILMRYKEMKHPSRS